MRMANLAQTINDLQALVLTRGGQMVLTPTYHVFDLFKVHQDAKWLPVSFKSPDYIMGEQKITALNASASRDSSGTVHITMVNLDPNRNIMVRTTFNNITWKQVAGQILSSAKLSDINSFDQPTHIHIENFTGAKKMGDMPEVVLPAKSIVMLELR